jgi:hypothetical protein
MKKDRFLTGILVGIGGLVVLALVLFFFRPDYQVYRADSAPDAVVHNYILAIINKDYVRAYGYLADLQHKPTYDEFRQAFLNGMLNPGSTGADIGQASISGDQASVILTVYYGFNDPFSSRSGTPERAVLVNQNGAWKVSSLPVGSYWGYDWYQDPYQLKQQQQQP